MYIPSVHVHRARTRRQKELLLKQAVHIRMTPVERCDGKLELPELNATEETGRRRSELSSTSDLP